MTVGIDLGTTNSLIAYYDGEKPVIIPNRLGEKLTPSVVAVDEDGTVYVGQTAKEIKLKAPLMTAEVFKRSMGTAKEYVLGERKFTAEELSSLVLRSLKDDAEAYFNEPVTEAVISVPAYFNDKQRKATKKAGELAGFKVERIISEPTAAAIAYGINDREADTRFLVFDLGGGTFDVSLLEHYKNIMEVRAVAGDNFLGGEDFTEILEQIFLRKNDIDEDSLDIKDKVRLRKQAELAKLAYEDGRKTVFKFKLGEKDYEQEISLDEYEKACQILLAKIKKPIERALKDADTKLADIDEVVLVGGATRLAILRRFVSRLFGRLPNTSINPDEVVACGAAIQAAMKERQESVKEVILTDVCPFTLGTSVSVMRRDGIRDNGHYLPMIERNTVIPVSHTEKLYTMDDNQTRIRVDILQGESRMAKNNVLLGEVSVPVPAGPAGTEGVEVVYTYDVNSILEVVVKVLSTGVTERVVIKNEDNDLSDEEIDERLKSLEELKLHPREKEENKLLLLRGNRMYEEKTGDARRAIEQAMNAFEETLDRQKPEEIKKERKLFKEFLDSMEEIED